MLQVTPTIIRYSCPIHNHSKVKHITNKINLGMPAQSIDRFGGLGGFSFGKPKLLTNMVLRLTHNCINHNKDQHAKLTKIRKDVNHKVIGF